MSLLPYSWDRPLGGWGVTPYRARSAFYDPFDMMLEPFHTGRLSQVLDSFFEDGAGQLMRLRDHAAKLELNEKEGTFTYKVDASGFKPDELKVDMEGDELVVSGEHNEQNQGEQVHRAFYRRVRLPEGINRESVKCEMNERGHLLIGGQRLAIEPEKKTSVPIEMKKK